MSLQELAITIAIISIMSCITIKYSVDVFNKAEEIKEQTRITYEIPSLE